MKTAFIVAFALLGLAASLGAQPPMGGMNVQVSISGTVVDSVSSEPLKFANVMLYDFRDSLITGTITNDMGRFTLKNLRPGIYKVSVKFMGFHKKTIERVRVGPRQPEVDLGVIALRPAVLSVGEVEVTAERPEITYKIDRKVINVSKQYTRTSGTAVDILENVPSVTVDVDGNVSLRGSGSFTVLIDGRPTPLQANEALQQIPATTIESIEIITNPSAKYDPDGIAGIINIILKKGKLRGMSGIFNLNGGLDYKYGGDFLLSKKGDGITYTFGADFNNREFPGNMESESQTGCPGCADLIKSKGAMRWQWRPYGIHGEVDWRADESNSITAGLRWGGRRMERSSNVTFHEYDIMGNPPYEYFSRGGWKRSGDFYMGSFTYNHKFARKGHELTAEATMSRSEGDEVSKTETFELDGTQKSGQRETETGPWRRIRAKADYVLPLDEKSKIEAGYQARLDASKTQTKTYEYDTSSGEYEYRQDFSHKTEYDRDIQSIYAMFSSNPGKFGYQIGLRGEYTYRSMHLIDTDENFKIDRIDLFPTLHVSYQHSAGTQFMASYSRRIRRPRNWHLEPFLTWFDANNVRKGNPDLKPEYTDSYEAGFQQNSGRRMLSLEAYYKVTHNKTERIQSVYEDQIRLHTIENVGKDYALGVELMLNIGLMGFWNVNVMGTAYDYRIKGKVLGEDFSDESFSWNARLNNTFRLGKATRVQFNAMYNSSRPSAQGTRKSFFLTDAAIKQDLMGGSLSISLQARDLFSTGKFDHTTEGEGFYDHRTFTRKSPSLTFTLSYNVNNYKKKREEGREEVPEMIQEGEF